VTKPARILFENAGYHITSLDAGYNNIFNSDNQRKLFLELLSAIRKRYHAVKFSSYFRVSTSTVSWTLANLKKELETNVKTADTVKLIEVMLNTG